MATETSADRIRQAWRDLMLPDGRPAREDLARVASLTNYRRYSIRMVRRVVDGDCDYTEVGVRWELRYIPVDVRRPYVVINDYESANEAAREIELRMGALDGEPINPHKCGHWSQFVE